MSIFVYEYMYKRLKNSYKEVLAGKGFEFGGSLVRTEAIVNGLRLTRLSGYIKILSYRVGHLRKGGTYPN